MEAILATTGAAPLDSKEPVERAVAKDGTTCVSVIYDGGILIAADTFSTAGVMVGNRVSDKLEPLHQRIYCQRSGTSAHTMTICKYIRYFLDIHCSETGELPLVEVAARIAQSILYKNKFLSGGLIISGWDPVRGYQIYQVGHGACFTSTIAASGSGSMFVKGYLDKNFRENMSKAEAYEFLKEAISLACYRDGSSGGCIRMVDITEEKLDRHFIKFNDKTIRN